MPITPKTSIFGQYIKACGFNCRKTKEKARRFEVMLDVLKQVKSERCEQV
jgi:hypothetical protein